MIACGDFHTVVLMATGEVVTFGEYKVQHVYVYYVKAHMNSQYSMGYVLYVLFA